MVDAFQKLRLKVIIYFTQLIPGCFTARLKTQIAHETSVLLFEPGRS